jgi:hypothetical protein
VDGRFWRARFKGEGRCRKGVLAVFDDRRIELLTRLCLSYRRDPRGDEIESQRCGNGDINYYEILHISI